MSLFELILQQGLDHMVNLWNWKHQVSEMRSVADRDVELRGGRVFLYVHLPAFLPSAFIFFTPSKEGGWAGTLGPSSRSATGDYFENCLGL